MAYDGILPNGRKVHVPLNLVIPIEVESEIYYVQTLPLAHMLSKLDIHSEEPSDWLKDDTLLQWLKATSIKRTGGPRQLSISR
jgi:hypothetical protein